MWQFDASAPIVTAARSVAAEQQRRGITPEQHALPPTMVATFQDAAYARLLERAEVAADARDPVDRPGGIGSRNVNAIGLAGGRPVRLTRLTVGAPATANSLETAIARGVRDILVVGSAASIQPRLRVGGVVVVASASREDGTSHHYLPAAAPAVADPDLTAMLEAAAGTRGATPLCGRSWTTDAPYRIGVDGLRRHRDAGDLVIEMEAAVIFAVAAVRGARAGLIVAVSDEVDDEWTPAFSHPSYLAALEQAADVVIDVASRLAGHVR